MVVAWVSCFITVFADIYAVLTLLKRLYRKCFFIFGARVFLYLVVFFIGYVFETELRLVPFSRFQGFLTSKKMALKFFWYILVQFRYMQKSFISLSFFIFLFTFIPVVPSTRRIKNLTVCHYRFTSSFLMYFL